MPCRKRPLRSLAIAAVVLLTSGAAAVAQQAPSIQFTGGAFRVLGWKAPPSPPAQGWPSVFAVYAGAGQTPPLAGAYAVEGGALVFHPAYPIAAGVHYRAVLREPGAAPIEKTFDGPPRATVPTARVEQVYPSGDVLPSNQLRLYIYFSAPMSRGEAAQHVHILDETGKALEGRQSPFLPGEELWDPAFRRLTLTFDPGRIKRGLTSNMAMGAPIAPGKRYTLVIDRDWPDARGVSMTAAFRKTFRGGPAVRTPPDPGQWRVTPPRAASRDALTVDFPEPMNFTLLQRMLRVSGPQGAVPGTVSVEDQERRWRFTPRAPWAPGRYRLVVDSGIEDLAGNHIGQPFDVDTFEHVTRSITSTSVSLPFAVR